MVRVVVNNPFVPLFDVIGRFAVSHFKFQSVQFCGLRCEIVDDLFFIRVALSADK